MIELKQVTHRYSSDDTHNAIDGLSLHIKKGEAVAFVGTSGCGKTTLLHLLAGFFKPSEGSILIDGKSVTRPTIDRVTVFQQYGLLPWRTVRKNVELGLEGLRLPRKERQIRAQKYIDLAGLSGSEKKHPHELSGGMQQRVAVARALAVEPSVLFLDEPFGALDPRIRGELQRELYSLTKNAKTTTILVTHDIDEAVLLADRIFVFAANPGRIIHEEVLTFTSPRQKGTAEFQKYRDAVMIHFASDSPEYEI